MASQETINAQAGLAASKSNRNEIDPKKFGCDSRQGDRIDCHGLDSDIMNEDLPSALVPCLNTAAGWTMSHSRELKEGRNTVEESPSVPSLALDAFIDEVISEWSEDSKSEQNHELNEYPVSPTSLRQIRLPNVQARLEPPGGWVHVWRSSRPASSMIDYAQRNPKDKQREEDFFTLSDWLGRTRRYRNAESFEKPASTGMRVLQVLSLLAMIISFVCLVSAAEFMYSLPSRG